MHSKDEIFKWVTDLMKREFHFRDEELRPSAHLVDDLDLDSIDAVDLAVRVEERTGLALTEADLKSIQTIQDIVDLIDGRL
jgi:acyl carrier protein